MQYKITCPKCGIKYDVTKEIQKFKDNIFKKTELENKIKN